MPRYQRLIRVTLVHGLCTGYTSRRRIVETLLCRGPWNFNCTSAISKRDRFQGRGREHLPLLLLLLLLQLYRSHMYRTGIWYKYACSICCNCNSNTARISRHASCIIHTSPEVKLFFLPALVLLILGVSPTWNSKPGNNHPGARCVWMRSHSCVWQNSHFSIEAPSLYRRKSYVIVQYSTVKFTNLHFNDLHFKQIFFSLILIKVFSTLYH